MFISHRSPQIFVTCLMLIILFQLNLICGVHFLKTSGSTASTGDKLQIIFIAQTSTSPFEVEQRTQAQQPEIVPVSSTSIGMLFLSSKFVLLVVSGFHFPFDYFGQVFNLLLFITLTSHKLFLTHFKIPIYKKYCKCSLLVVFCSFKITDSRTKKIGQSNCKLFTC